MSKRSAVFFILYFILTVNLHGQKSRISFKRISIEQGLSQNTIPCICQDSRGFMWFETYDGLSFTAYNHKPTNPNTISHNTISYIQRAKIEFGKIKINNGTILFTKDNGYVKQIKMEGKINDGAIIYFTLK